MGKCDAMAIEFFDPDSMGWPGSTKPIEHGDPCMYWWDAWWLASWVDACFRAQEGNYGGQAIAQFTAIGQVISHGKQGAR